MKDLRRRPSGNRGHTTLKRKRRREDPMREFDRLPAELRTWLSGAVLPWRPRSVLNAYKRALTETGDRSQALRELDRLQDRLVTRDAPKVWGHHHPCALDARSPGQD